MYFHGPWRRAGLLPPPPSPIATLLEITLISRAAKAILRSKGVEHKPCVHRGNLCILGNKIPSARCGVII